MSIRAFMNDSVVRYFCVHLQMYRVTRIFCVYRRFLFREEEWVSVILCVTRRSSYFMCVSYISLMLLTCCVLELISDPFWQLYLCRRLSSVDSYLAPYLL